MLNQIPNFKNYIFLLLFACIFSGCLFGFVFDKYWSTEYIQKTEYIYHFKSNLFYIFCITSFFFQGVSFALISEHPDKKQFKTAVILYWGQFILGFLWLGLFFILKSYGIALTVLFLSVYMLLFAYNSFKQLDFKAGFLLIPQGVLYSLVGTMNMIILLY